MGSVNVNTEQSKILMKFINSAKLNNATIKDLPELQKCDHG